VHGLAEAAVQGGASGAIIVADREPAACVAGLPERVLVVRDQNVAGAPTAGGVIPAWDVSLNYVPIPYVSTPQPGFIPSIIKMKVGQREFWRVSNSSADTILICSCCTTNVAQPLQDCGTRRSAGELAGRDGPRQYDHSEGRVDCNPRGARKFIVTAPTAAVHKAVLQTLNIDTGPAGDNDPTRPLAVIQASTASTGLPVTEVFIRADFRKSLCGFGHRHAHGCPDPVFFGSDLNPSDPSSPTNFFITVDGATPTLFDPNNRLPSPRLRFGGDGQFKIAVPNTTSFTCIRSTSCCSR